MAQEQNSPEQQTERWSNAPEEAPEAPETPETPEASSTSGDGKPCWSPPWLNVNLDTYTSGMRSALSAWSSFVSDQCKVASSYDPQAGSIATQTADALRKYAEGVSDRSNKLIEIAGDVYSPKNWMPGSGCYAKAADDDAE